VDQMINDSGYDRIPLDAYWTQPWCLEWALDKLQFDDMGKGVIWEPACGEGHLSEVLRLRGADVLSTDIKDYGYEHFNGVSDFMAVDAVDPSVRMIVTNPPFDIKEQHPYPDVDAEQFARHAVQLMEPVKGSVLLIMRNEFDSAGTRKDLFGGCDGFYVKLPLTRRPRWLNLPVLPGKKKSGPRHNYSWFYWNWSQHIERPPFPYIMHLYGGDDAVD
jgi:hypothetical protein